MTVERAAYPSEEADKYIVRFPRGMRDQLKEAAKSNGRTMNAEIVARLEQSFAPPVSDNGVSLQQAIQELQSLQTLATLNYRLERAIYKADLTRSQLGVAHQQLQATLVAGSKEEQREAKAALNELQAQMDQYKANIDAIEKQISEIHLERKVTGLKELRDVDAISTSVQTSFKSRK